MGGHGFSSPSKEVHIRGAAGQGQARSTGEEESQEGGGSSNVLGQNDIKSSPPHPLSTLALLPHSRPCRGGEQGQSKASGVRRLAMEAMEGRARVAEQD